MAKQIRVSCSLAFLLLYGCSTAPLMQESGYHAIAIGSEIQGVEAMYGEAYDVRELPNGVQEYRYLTRIPCGMKDVDQVEYVFQVHQGKIVGKNSKNISTCDFQFSN